jgi:acetyltransferase-like isoleucine patch superfamily enzyme
MANQKDSLILFRCSSWHSLAANRSRCRTVERGSWVGVGSVVREGVHIGSDVMIGAGSVVLHDIPDGVLAYGVPAAVIRKRVPPDNDATYQQEKPD